MNLKKWIKAALPVMFLGSALSAGNNNNSALTNVPAANPKVPGVAPANILSPELSKSL